MNAAANPFQMQLLEPRVFFSAGDLDPTFGDGGRVQIDIAGCLDEATATFVQADGKIVVAGYGNIDNGGPHALVLRLNSDGSLDTTFGTNGITQLSGVERFDAVTEAPDGSIVAAGEQWAAYDHGWNGSDDWAVAHISPSGQVDNTFGNDGIARIFLSKTSDMPTTVVVTPTGQILIAGIAGFGGTGRPKDSGDFAVARLDGHGQLDPSFGTGGVVMTNLGTSTLFSADQINAMVLQKDGKIVVGGWACNGEPDDTIPNSPTRAVTAFALARYNTDGTLDPTFGNDGLVTTIIPDHDDPKHTTGEISDLAILPDGKILAVGDAQGPDVALVRYTAAGEVDASFGTNGVTLTSGPDTKVYRLHVETNGSISVVGAQYGMYFARFTADGQTLATKIVRDNPSLRMIFNGSAIDADGNMIAFGRIAPTREPNVSATNWLNTNDMLIARFQTDSIVLPPVIQPPVLAPPVIQPVVIVHSNSSHDSEHDAIASKPVMATIIESPAPSNGSGVELDAIPATTPQAVALPFTAPQPHVAAPVATAPQVMVTPGASLWNLVNRIESDGDLT